MTDGKSLLNSCYTENYFLWLRHTSSIIQEMIGNAKMFCFENSVTLKLTI